MAKLSDIESENMKFGGPREVGGAVDLITQYKLLPHHEFFCKRPVPKSLSDAHHYLRNVVGETDIRKGEGMQLNQLIAASDTNMNTNARKIQPFVLDELKEAFEINDMAPIELPLTEKGAPTIESKSKDKEKKHKERNKEKDKKQKHKHKHKDKDRERKKDKSRHKHDKKRKHNKDDDLDDVQKHKKSKGL